MESWIEKDRFFKEFAVEIGGCGEGVSGDCGVCSQTFEINDQATVVVVRRIVMRRHLLFSKNDKKKYFV